MGGLYGAYQRAQKDVAAAERRLDRIDELFELEKAELAALESHDVPRDQIAREAVQSRSNQRYVAEGIVRPTWGNSAKLPQYVALNISQSLVASARNGLVVAGAGVLASGAGGVLTAVPSLF
jgi:hypothetical protein